MNSPCSIRRIAPPVSAPRRAAAPLPAAQNPREPSDHPPRPSLDAHWSRCSGQCLRGLVSLSPPATHDGRPILGALRGAADSWLAKKKVRSLMIGPPNAQPPWLRRRVCFWAAKKRPRVHGVIPQKVVEGAVELIRSRLGRHLNEAAAGASHLGLVVRDFDVHLLKGFDRGIEVQRSDTEQNVLGRTAIQRPHGVVRAAAGDLELRARAASRIIRGCRQC